MFLKAAVGCLGQVLLAWHSSPYMRGTKLMIKQTTAYTVLYPFIVDMGGQNREKLGSPAWNYGPKQCIILWLFHLLNFIQSVQLHALAFPEKEKQHSTGSGFNLHWMIWWLAVHS